MILIDDYFKEPGYSSGAILLRDLSRHSPCKALIKEAQNTIRRLGLNALEIRLEPPTGGGSAEQENNIIRISPNLSAPEQRALAVMELTNVCQLERHRELLCAAIEGLYETAEAFARAQEFIEFKGVKRWKAVTQAVNRQHGRPSKPYMVNGWEKYPVESMGFNLYYEKYLSQNHKEYNRRRWRELLQVSGNNYTQSGNHTLKIAKIALSVALVAIVTVAFLNWARG